MQERTSHDEPRGPSSSARVRAQSQGGGSATHAPASALGLLERDSCLQDLVGWLDVAVEQGGLVVLLSGEAGVGKTTLVQELAKRQHKVARVLWGACDALFTPRPFAPLHDIGRQTQQALLAALAAGNRDAIFAAALDEVERGPPSLIVLEDMHWADEATLDLLTLLGRRVQRTRSLLVITYREDEVGTHHRLRFVFGELPRSSLCRMHLSPLSETAVATLAQRAGRPAEGLHRITGGNPFFVTEALAAADDAIPSTVRDAVLARAHRLSPAARAIAELVALVPGKAESWLVQEAARIDDDAIEQCLAIGMVRGTDDSLAFRHELARQALEDSLPQSHAQELHARLLAILKRRSDIPPARLAHHAGRARSREDVLRFASAAATQASTLGAHREAVAQYRLALTCAAAASEEERARLHEQLSYECYLTDQIDAAIEARLSALAIWRAAGVKTKEGDALRWCSRLSWYAGRRAAAEQYALDAVSVLDALPPGPELAMAYNNRAQLDIVAGNVDSAIEWARRTMQLAESAGRDEILSHALNNLGTARLEAGDRGGSADLNRGLSLALTRGLHEQAGLAYSNLVACAVGQRRYEDGLRYLQEGLAYCEQHDLDSYRLHLLASRARLEFERGDWNLATDDAEAILRDPHTAPITRIPAMTILAHLRIRHGDSAEGSPLEEAWQLARETQELQRLAPLATAEADAAWLAGAQEQIAGKVRPTYELAQHGHCPWLKGELAAWLWRVDALDKPPVNVAEPYALEMSGDWRAAARAWQTLGCPYEQATVLAWHGGEPEQLDALATLERLGASAAANALRRQMRARGIRKIPRGSRASTRNHPQGLTRREVQVLALLGEGLRNSTIATRLFLSTKTVDHHVSSILMKLGATSRAEAVALARKSRADQS